MANLADGVVSSQRLRIRHGAARRGQRTTEYVVWVSMWQRCTNPRHRYWHCYGGRGISVDPRWREFEVFLADMGERPQGHTLDRIDSDGPYTPTNCRWATAKEQGQNRRKPKHHYCGKFVGPGGHNGPCNGESFEDYLIRVRGADYWPDPYSEEETTQVAVLTA